jgi:hypothetical protein
VSSPGSVLAWLDDKSDWLSPIVVKEVRQVVRGREFQYSFAASLLAALAIAFFGAADALTGSGVSGAWTFGALMACLTLLGVIVVPLGAFNALRNERMEQTFDLITVTALSSRRIVIGKLLAQGVKLTTLFAAIAPFIAMSFLLGGIDFFTILISVLVLFLWSMWASAAFLFFSTLATSRAMSGLVFGAVVILLFFLLTLSRFTFFMARGGPFFGASRADVWWVLAMATTACLATMMNLVLLAENRLAGPAENTVTPLRAGFLAQFLLITAWILTFINEPSRVQADAIGALGAIGGVHLALVATFAVTEGLVVPRRVLIEMRRAPARAWLLAAFRPGGGRGAVYVLAQMALLLAVAALFRPPAEMLRWMLAICAYICFFTGVPTLFWRVARPAAEATLQVRVVILALLVAALVLPDVIYYVFWQPASFDLVFARRHLINPFRTLTNWRLVETYHWSSAPFAMGAAGVAAYLALINIGRRMTARDAPLDSPRSPIAPLDDEGPRRADALY